MVRICTVTTIKAPLAVGATDEAAKFKELTVFGEPGK